MKTISHFLTLGALALPMLIMPVVVHAAAPVAADPQLTNQEQCPAGQTRSISTTLCEAISGSTVQPASTSSQEPCLANEKRDLGTTLCVPIK
jgi:hypothetical protein